MPRYQATYRDPVDGKITHYWEFNETDMQTAKKRAKETILQRKDGLEDVLDKVELIES
jgi:hypothetical protein